MSSGNIASFAPIADVARFLLTLALFVGLNALGGWLADITGVPVPGSVIGMLLLTALLELKVIPVAFVRAAGELLIRHLALLYVPAGAALILYWSAVRRDALAIAVASVASLVAVLLGVGIVAQRLERDT